MRTLETVAPLVVGSAGVSTPPGPSHWNWESGTPPGIVTEQVSVRVSPDMTEVEKEEVREMATGSV